MTQATMTQAEMQAEIARLTAERDTLLADCARRITLKVSEKGAVSLYGMGRFPVTLYVEQWETVLDMEPTIRDFLAKHSGELTRKAPAPATAPANGSSTAEALRAAYRR